MTKNMNWICPMTAILNFMICGKTGSFTAWHTAEMDSEQNFHIETINEVLFLKNAYRSLSRAIFQFLSWLMLMIYICCLSWHIFMPELHPTLSVIHTAVSRLSNDLRKKCGWWWFTTNLAFATPTKRYSQILIFLPYPPHFAGVDSFPRVIVIFLGDWLLSQRHNGNSCKECIDECHRAQPDKLCVLGCLHLIWIRDLI